MFESNRLFWLPAPVWVLSLAVLCVAGGGVTSRCHATLPFAPSNGLNHYWALDESAGTTAVDSAGGQPGTLLGGPAWQPLAGRFGGAVEFDGADDRIDLGTMDAPSTAAVSITMWVRADDFDVPDGRLISKATGTQAEDHYWMVSTISSTGIRFRLKAGGTTATLASAPGVIGAGEWYHIAVTYDGATMRIYRDGVEVANTPKAGAVDTDAGVAVAMGNQPPGAGDKPFDGMIDDVRVYNRALVPDEVASMVPPKPPFTFNLWYGDAQETGHRGTPQQWVNIVGNVTHSTEIDSFYYRLDGAPPAMLSTGPDGFRLVNEGDFTIEIDVADLAPGANDVVISGVHVNGKRADTTVVVTYAPGVAHDLPDTLRFESAAAVLDVATVVDGCWELVAGGVRTCGGTMGYDRLLAAGQLHWGSDVEVLVPITIHDFETSFPDNGPAIGVGFGWQGHTGSEQPRHGHPYQSIGFIRGLTSSPYLQLMRNGDVGVAVVPASIALDTRYLMRVRTEALTTTTSRVRMKVWEDGTGEPGAWQIQSDFTRRGGSILFIAHRADVTFGDAIIQPLGGVLVDAGAVPAPRRLALYPNVPNPFGDGTTIRVGLAAPAELVLDVFDVRGRRVHHDVVTVVGAGVHEFPFGGTGRGGEALPSGVYFCRVRALGDVVTRKMVISR